MQTGHVPGEEKNGIKHAAAAAQLTRRHLVTHSHLNKSMLFLLCYRKLDIHTGICTHFELSLDYAASTLLVLVGFVLIAQCARVRVMWNQHEHE